MHDNLTFKEGTKMKVWVMTEMRWHKRYDERTGKYDPINVTDVMGVFSSQQEAFEALTERVTSSKYRTFDTVDGCDENGIYNIGADGYWWIGEQFMNDIVFPNRSYYATTEITIEALELNMMY
jgi:hypothetical protein